jgi:hypothetical protein
LFQECIAARREQVFAQTIEAVTGQLYVAMLVATLVTQYVGRARSE